MSADDLATFGVHDPAPTLTVAERTALAAWLARRSPKPTPREYAALERLIIPIQTVAEAADW